MQVVSQCPQVYEGGSNVDQFVTRFLLKETANQIQSLLSSVESAVEAIEEQTNQIRCVRGTYWGTHSSLTLHEPQIWVTLGELLHLSVHVYPAPILSNYSMRT